MLKRTLTLAILFMGSFSGALQATEKPSVESVISMPSGHFFENLTYKSEDTLIATDYTGQSLYKYSEQGLASLWAKVDGHPVSIRFDERGQGLLSVHEVSILAGDRFLNNMALFRVDSEGELTKLVSLDTPAFLNGMVYLGNQKYLIADAANGRIFEFDMSTNNLSTWLEAEHLLPDAERPGLPGVNGIQLNEGALYFTNSAKQSLGKITLSANGQAESIDIVKQGIQADDFIIDARGDWYITTHHDEIIKYSADGTQTTLLSDGVAGNTAIQMSNRDEGYFYVTNDGGFLFGGTEGAGLHKVKF